ncbi:hypothetical protein KCU65_g246, partial [Aureobasidium melanogenum]
MNASEETFVSEWCVQAAITEASTALLRIHLFALETLDMALLLLSRQSGQQRSSVNPRHNGCVSASQSGRIGDITQASDHVMTVVSLYSHSVLTQHFGRVWIVALLDKSDIIHFQVLITNNYIELLLFIPRNPSISISSSLWRWPQKLAESHTIFYESYQLWTFSPIGIVEVQFVGWWYMRIHRTPIGLPKEWGCQSTAVFHVEKNVNIGDSRKLSARRFGACTTFHVITGVDVSRRAKVGQLEHDRSLPRKLRKLVSTRLDTRGKTQENLLLFGPGSGYASHHAHSIRSTACNSSRVEIGQNSAVCIVLEGIVYVSITKASGNELSISRIGGFDLVAPKPLGCSCPLSSRVSVSGDTDARFVARRMRMLGCKSDRQRKRIEAKSAPLFPQQIGEVGPIETSCCFPVVKVEYFAGRRTSVSESYQTLSHRYRTHQRDRPSIA